MDKPTTIERCKYCKQDEKGYHEDKCPQTRVHELYGIVQEVYEDVKKFRQLLWLNHGCPISKLYGDDGELQCSQCRVDFLRDSPQQIAEKWQMMDKEGG